MVHLNENNKSRVKETQEQVTDPTALIINLATVTGPLLHARCSTLLTSSMPMTTRERNFIIFKVNMGKLRLN